MRFFKNLPLTALIAIASPSFSQQLAKVMTKVEVRLEGPDIPAGSFATKPKVMYRSGSRYCRIEEVPDPDKGIHALAVINEPDYWMVNLLDKTAKHALDPGPTFNCHLPVFPDTDKDLEFGLEIQYFRTKGATAQTGPVLQTKSTTLYKVDLGNSISLAMFTYGTPERPMAVARTRGDKGEIFWFSGWGDVPFDPTLFSKPQGVKIEEQKP